MKLMRYGPKGAEKPALVDDHRYFEVQPLYGTSISVVTVLDGHDLHLIGQVPGAPIQGVGAQIEDADETQLLFGVSNRGVSFIDAASPVALSAAAPSFTAAPASIPRVPARAAQLYF